MPIPIAPISSPIVPVSVPGPQTSKGTGAFQSALEKAIGEVEQFHQTADQSVGQFLAGEGGELHGAIMATQRAQLAFDLFLQVRNKVVDAYQEVMRLQL
jgi:flagellar hook-basal body complex protein FliE